MATIANVSLDLRGALTSRPATCNAVNTAGSSGPTFNLALRTENKSATQEASSTLQVIDSADDFIALPIAANQRSTVIYLRTLEFAPMSLRLTFEVSDPVVLPIRGAFLLELPADDRLTTVEIQGQGQIEWLAAGGIV